MDVVPFHSLSQVLRLLQQLAELPSDSFCAEMFKDNMHDAQDNPFCGNWAAGIHKKHLDLGMQLPFAFDGVQAISAHIFRQLTEHTKSVWAGIFPHARLHLPEQKSAYNCAGPPAQGRKEGNSLIPGSQLG